MKLENVGRLLNGIGVILIAVALLFGLLALADAQAGDVQEMFVSDTTFTSLSVSNGLTLDAGGLTVTAGGISITDGDLTVADDLILTGQTSITVTNGAAFAPTGSYQPIAAASEVTPTVTVAGAGTLVTLINTGTNVVNLADTGTAKLSAAAALGQYDSLTLLSDGTNWIEVSRSDN